MMKKLLSVVFVTSVLALAIEGTLSFFGDTEKSFGNYFTTGVVDLEVNGQNPLEGAVIAINDAEPCHVYYEKVTLHMTTESNPSLVKMRFFNLSNNSTPKGVVHKYGELEKEGEANVTRSDGTNVSYEYEAKPVCIKFEDAEIQLGEDDTVGLTDKFVITFYNGTLPVNGEIKTGAGTIYFTINDVGDEIEIYYYGVLTYKVRLVSIEGFTFTFEVESIAKPGNTGLSHVAFCFSKGNDPREDLEIDLSITNTSSGETFILLDFNEHKTLFDLQNEWINLTEMNKIPEFMPCIDYAINVSIHFDSSVCGTEINFDIDFYAEQKME